ncbi:hypothetical protein BS50DRAFT_580894 [Corynespora cassiicola Philippines]|uniref:Uncharacterized protein n=1 Tax=Corynespora cassiicola Philippines TaxID=1448308 RepID=A0A2T2P8Q6_CORCC|nr:hypothetical protein BS50DRAFT_580894 [Corynespora cassiicola Philippines]
MEDLNTAIDEYENLILEIAAATPLPEDKVMDYLDDKRYKLCANPFEKTISTKVYVATCPTYKTVKASKGFSPVVQNIFIDDDASCPTSTTTRESVNHLVLLPKKCSAVNSLRAPCRHSPETPFVLQAADPLWEDLENKLSF